MTTNSGIGGFLQSQATEKVAGPKVHPKIAPDARTPQSQPVVDFAGLLVDDNALADQAKKAAPPQRQRPAPKQQVNAAASQPSRPAPRKAPARPTTDTETSAEKARPRKEAPAQRPSSESSSDQSVHNNKRADSANSKAGSANERESRTDKTGALAETSNEQAEKVEKKKSSISAAALNKLKSAFDTKGAALSKTPVLALLSGHVEQLDPQAIPEIVSSNDFLTKAFQFKDISDYMDQPQELGQLISAIDPSSEIVGQLQALGLDLGQTVSPNQFLRAIGIDQQRVQTEIQLIKQSMQSNDGLAPYMVRSAKLRARLGDVGLTESVTSKDPEAPGSVANKWESNRTINAEGKEGNGPRSPIEAGQSKQVATNTGEFEGNAKLLKQAPAARQIASNSDTDQAMADAGAQRVGTDQASPVAVADTTGGISKKTGSIDALKSAAAANINAGKNQDLQRTETAKNSVSTDDPRPTSESNTPRIRTTNVDPFAQIQDRMSQSVQMNPSPTSAEPKQITPDSKIENSLRQNELSLEALPFNKPVFNVGENRGLDPAATPSQENQMTPIEWMANQVEGEAVTNYQNKSNYQNFGNANDAGLLNTTNTNSAFIRTGIETAAAAPNSQIDSAALANVLDRMAVQGMSKSNNGNTHSGSQGGSGDQNSGAGRGEGILTGHGLGTQAAGKSSRAFSLEADPSSQNSSTFDRAEMVKKIANKAEMMVKDGGGSMKIEFGKGAGEKIEIAFQVDGEKLELKILAPNSEVRDALNSQLPKLKEALASQNLNLSDAEVGVNTGESSLQNQQNKNSWNAESQEDGKNTWMSQNKNESAPRAPRNYNAASAFTPRPNHQGQIQVMV